MVDELKLKLCLVLLGLSVSLSVCLEPQGLEYNLYSTFDQQSLNSQEFFVRVKRDSVEEEAASSSSGGQKSAESTTTVATNTADNTSSSSTGPQVVEDNKNRGWQPPENETTILKEIDLNEAKINATLDSHIKDEGLTNLQEHYKYYNSTFIPFNDSWIDLEEWNKTTHPGIVYQHSMLSRSYRRAATISLKFDFLFYGHPVKNITIATGGFLYTGEYVHSWLAATQYIAPLMANFDTSTEDSATVKYADNGTTLVVEWGNVYLQGREGAHMEGPFTFQAILHANGDIVFAYKTIPVSIMTIADEEHPVKVGLSDAYIIERTIFFVKRKTIYEYHRVNMKGREIANLTAIYLKALPRCNMKTDCKSCLALTVRESGQDVQCKWCDSAKLCSDGFDRNKQNWLKNNCDKSRNYVDGDLASCDAIVANSDATNRDYNPSYSFDEDHDHSNEDHLGHDEDSEHFKDTKSNPHHTAVALLVIVIILIVTMFGWCLYAYFFPHTCSGQLLIKYRPSRWHWRRGEPRYTAASIHM